MLKMKILKKRRDQMSAKHNHEQHQEKQPIMSHDKMNHMNHDMAHEQMAMSHQYEGMKGMDHSMHMGNFKQKFWLSLILAIPIIVLSPMMGFQLPFQFTFPGSDWLVLILATVLFFYGGQPFLSGAKMELQQKSPAMMTLIAMGISVSYFYSLYAFYMNHFTNQAHVMDFFWELATLIVIMLLGHWIEMNAISNAGDALKKMAELLPDTVKRMTEHGEEEIPLQDVQEGDRLIVRSGDKIPTDGKILKGSTTVDESMVTGESKTVEKNIGDSVIGGAVNGNGMIEISVTGTGENSYLSKVMEMVKQAQSEKSKLESISDRVAKWLFYIALFVGVLAFIGWLLVTKDLSLAFERMVTVFIIACPHALGLAIPLVIARSTSIAAKNGLLLKNRNALEQANKVEYVLLDKTGTLTEGQFTVTGLELMSKQFTREEALKYIGALEKNANHPLAIGIMNYLNKQAVQPYEAHNLQALSGVGLVATVQNQEVKIVNEKEVARLQLTFDETIKTNYQEQGNTLSYLIIAGQLVALLALGDKVKPEAKTFIAELQAQGITPVMLTGDNQTAASAVANYLGMKEYYAELLPEDKEKIVQQYLTEGHQVMMVGDGINDAPSLARASIGIAIGAGTDVAIDSADVVLTDSDPKDILRFLDLAKQTRRKMIQNLWWGAGYNIVAIPLAAGVLAPLGIVLNPAVGAVLMSLSTIIVAANAMTLHISKK
ncbi:TPA: copper-translocating P-type ATPase [Enterococcus faecalis]|uniref:heavy metal translocating P-type ATPase n=1 Tax=Enterococcus faecalis TaxID=1351 RepID=UPI0019230237|nr:copper-translocating P-type ATPase [Enterococcus faecalis]EIR3903509.1 copper-translocating P-type ATPase [Enterococcus faecalis]HAP3772779.1 copper-translocating P-type ATPase [Enterococcus faecalis]HAP3780117.1 copper-translocating P-type ATPase [Enterococcus faecalis]HAP3791854.1 copper-translocating P-type ATPase [Enterococcus faecalis]